MTVYTDGIHLTADEEHELHDFAKKLGLKPAWFQNHPRHPHYRPDHRADATQGRLPGGRGGDVQGAGEAMTTSHPASTESEGRR